ncbi:MAG: hypothetical protein C0506_14185 [Anaerolinea sp.]|nr:hypothetical protein [Anaerolinea sp.]
MQPDHYATLEVTPGASAEAVRAAYRRLAKEHHPDRNASAEAKARMQALNEAWAVLGDPAKRAEFDRERRPGSNSQQAAWGAAYGPPRPAPGARARPGGPAPSSGGHTAAGGQSVFEDEAEPSRFRGRVNARRPGPRHFTGDPNVDWYSHLGVRRNAASKEILDALAKKAAELKAATDISAAEFTERARRNKEAWETLGNMHVRAEYDRARRELGQ